MPILYWLCQIDMYNFLFSPYICVWSPIKREDEIIRIFLRLKTPKISRNVACIGELDNEHARPVLNGWTRGRGEASRYSVVRRQ